MFISFHAQGGASVSEVNGDVRLPDGGSTLASRYALKEGVVTDLYPGKTDAQVIAVHQSEHAARVIALETLQKQVAVGLSQAAPKK